jgi:hypothetical protein
MFFRMSGYVRLAAAGGMDVSLFSFGRMILPSSKRNTQRRKGGGGVGSGH